MKNAEMFKVTSLLFEGKEEVLDEAGFFDKLKNKISGNKPKTASGPQPKNNQEWEDYQEPQKPVGNATAVQRPAGAPLPQQIGNNDPNNTNQRVAGVKKQEKQADDRNAIRATNNSPMDQFIATLEVNMSNISKVSERVAQNNIPREHFKAHLDILSNMENVYMALGRASNIPKVKQASAEMNADLRATMKTLLKYTKGTKTA